MYWYILIFSILFLILWYTSVHEGFVTSLNVTVANSIAHGTQPDDHSAEVAFGSNTFHTKQNYYIAETGTNATGQLLDDIQFCKSGALMPNPFSDSRFASICGICMTQGSVLLDKFSFTQGTQRAGTGVVVYKEDKDFSLKDGSQAIPSAHSAFCDALVVDPEAVPANVSTHNLTGLAVNAQQYSDTTTYLNAMNTLSFASSSCSPAMSQPITCSNANATISSLRFLYGHFNDECESGSNVRTLEKPSDCLGEQSCTFTRNLPEGQRQWFLDAECKVQEGVIPSGLPNVFQRSVTGLPSSLSNLTNVPYYWADPYNSLSPDTLNFTLYSTCSVPNDTQVQIEFCTSASLDLYLHTLKQYSHRSTGKVFVYMSNSPPFTLYKGANTIKLKVGTKQSTNNGLYFRLKDLNGNILTTLDSTWVYSVPQGFDIQTVPTAKYPVHAKTLWSTVAALSPANQSTRTINYFKEISLASTTLLNFGTLLFHRGITTGLNPSFSYSTYLTYNGVEKQITSSTDNTSRAQAYSEYFPAGVTTIRISVKGDGDTCLIAILCDMNQQILASTDSSWTCDEIAYSGPMVDLLDACDGSSNTIGTFGPGTYKAGEQYIAGTASYIKVPVGLNAVLTNKAGTSKSVPGGTSLNFCNEFQFNDNVTEIVVTAGAPLAMGPVSRVPVTTHTYSVQDFVTFTADGTDLPGQPMIGTVSECQAACSAQPSCLGFSRSKGAAPEDSVKCWLKQNMDTKIARQSYNTYVKN